MADRTFSRFSMLVLGSSGQRIGTSFQVVLSNKAFSIAETMFTCRERKQAPKKKRQKSYTPQYQFIEALQLCPRRLTTPYLTRLGTKYGYGINVEVPEEKCTITASTCPIPKLDDGPKGLLPLPPVLLSSV